MIIIINFKFLLSNSLIIILIIKFILKNPKFQQANFYIFFYNYFTKIKRLKKILLIYQ